jgi:H+/Cl- antiporter ClcA
MNAPAQAPAQAPAEAPAPAQAPQMSGGAYLRLVLLGILIGIPAALFASVFLALVHDLEHWLWHDLPDALGEASPPWYLVIGLPTAGACIVAVARRFLPGDGGHEPLGGFAGKPPRLSFTAGIALAAIGSLSFGAVLGPEGPLIALGAVVGLAVAALFRLSAQEGAVLGNAGSFSAISALFGGPIVGGVLMMEGAIGFGASTIPILLPGFVAAATGYLIFIGLGNWGGLSTEAITVPGLPPYTGSHLGDLDVALGVGIVAALVVVVVRLLGHHVADRKPTVGMPVLLICGGLAVGLLAQTAEWLGASSDDVLFSGQASVPTIVTESSAKIVLIVLVAKALAYGVSLGCGFRGGPVFPGIFLGVALATLPVIWFNVSPTLAVAVGTAAGMAAVTRMLLTPMLFAALLVGHNGIDAVPAAVLAASTAWLLVALLDKREAAREAQAPIPAAAAPSEAAAGA